ncbi:MAG: O-antigen ligase family protein [bacterium]
MAARILAFLIIGVALIFDPKCEAIYDIPKIALLFSLSILSFVFFIREGVKRRFILASFGLLEFFILLYLLANIISTIFSLSPWLSIFGIYRRYDGMNTLLCYILLFFLSSNVEKPKEILYSIMIAAGISAIYGILQHFGIYIIPSGTGKERPISTFGNPNFFACYVLMSIPIILSFYLKEKKYHWLILLAIVLVSLLFTKTRATFIGLFFELAFFFIFLKPQKKALLVIVSILIIPSLILCIPIIKRIKDVGKDKARIGLYKGSFDVFLKHPLLGTGPECLHPAFIKNLPQEFISTYKGAYILADKSHNEFLDILATRGIIAFVLWIIILGVIFKMAISSKDKQYTIPIASSIFGYLVQAQFNLSLFSITYLLWIMMGLIALIRKKKKIPLKHPRLIISLVYLASFVLFFHIALFYISEIYFHKGEMLSRSGYKDKAIAYYKKASDFNKWEREYKKRYIETLLDIGRKDEAEEIAKKALKFASDEPKIWFLLARLNEEKDIGKAIFYYKKVLEISPYWADPYNNLAIVYVSNRNYKMAEKYFLISSSLNPDYRENLKNLYKEKTGVYLKENRLKEAKNEALKVLKIDKKDSYARDVLRFLQNFDKLKKKRV